VVVVNGLPHQRDTWAQEARIHYGEGAFIYNTITDIPSLAALIGQFPPGSIGKLVIGGHSEGGNGVQLGPANNLDTRINLDNLKKPANAASLQTIKSGLGGPTSTVQFESCCYGNQAQEIQSLADLFNTKVTAAKNVICNWEDPNGGWVTKYPR
jgi:hypothetical protein